MMSSGVAQKGANLTNGWRCVVSWWSQEAGAEPVICPELSTFLRNLANILAKKMLSTWHTCVILGLWSVFTDQKVLRLLCRKSAKHIVHLRDFEPWLFLYIAQRFVSEECKFPIVFRAACHASYAASGLSSPVSPRKQKLSSCREAPHCQWGWTRLGWVRLSPVYRLFI